MQESLPSLSFVCPRPLSLNMGVMAAPVVVVEASIAVAVFLVAATMAAGTARAVIAVAGMVTAAAGTEGRRRAVTVEEVTAE